VNAGLHMISPELLQRMKGPKKTDLDREVLKPLSGTGSLFAFDSPEYVKDIGTPQRFREAESDLRTGAVQSRESGWKHRAAFFDRDGTINRYEGFLTDIDRFELVPGISGMIRTYNRRGFLVIVVTNQPVIARGELSFEELGQIHNKMETLLGREGAYVDDIFVCPHHPDAGFPGERREYKVVCDCRKPKPGLLFKAAEKYGIDLSQSVMIGDTQVDMDAGKAAGCRECILVRESTLEMSVL